MAKRRIKLSLKRDEALTATRLSVGKGKLVYLLIADKKLKYRKGRSRSPTWEPPGRGLAALRRVSQPVLTIFFPSGVFVSFTLELSHAGPERMYVHG